MPTIKISRKALADITSGDKPVVYYDATLKGFGLKVMPTGAKSWIIEYRPGAGGRGVAKKRIKIGTLVSHFTPSRQAGGCASSAAFSD